MVECTDCSNGCSVRRQKTFQNGFPKKLLVATSVVVIITMCLIPAEAKAIHKIRHDRRHDPTKDGKLRVQEARVIDHRRRLRKQTLSTQTHISKEMDPTRLQRIAQAERFKNATKKIVKKLKNTRRFFTQERKVLNETREYRDGMPSWLPTINFVDIHFFNYRTPRQPGTTVTERKFVYLMPKLYKSLVEYQEIFKHLINIQVDFPDDPFYAYNRTRHELIGSTLEKLYSTIAEIKENMMAVKMPVPHLNPTKNLSALEMRVDATRCLKNDYIAFRAYGNLLNNWYSEFRCPRGKKVISTNNRCAAYEAKLTEKRDMRINTKSRKPLS